MAPGTSVLVRSCDGGNIEVKCAVGRVGKIKSFCHYANMYQVEFPDLGYFWFKEKHLEIQKESNDASDIL